MILQPLRVLRIPRWPTKRLPNHIYCPKWLIIVLSSCMINYALLTVVLPTPRCLKWLCTDASIQYIINFRISAVCKKVLFWTKVWTYDLESVHASGYISGGFRGRLCCQITTWRWVSKSWVLPASLVRDTNASFWEDNELLVTCETHILCHASVIEVQFDCP